LYKPSWRRAGVNPVPTALFVGLQHRQVFSLLMQTNKREKKGGVRRPDVRSLKIQPKIRFNQWSTSTAPKIKLCGSWLEKLGFHHGKRVVVTTMNELLIIRLQPE